MKHIISREQAFPPNAGNTVRSAAASSPSNTVFYDEEIPKFYPGQAGFKSFIRKQEKAEIKKTKALVEWKISPQGIVQKAKVYNMPGVNDRNLT